MHILVIKNKNECVIPYINKTFKHKKTNVILNISIKIRREMRCKMSNKFDGKEQGISVKVNVNTTELDSAIEKVGILKEKISANGKVLIIQAKCLMNKEKIKEEETRIKDITGMKVCIVNGNYEIVGLV